MKKIGFVTPWFGMSIPGGAEAELRGLTLHLSKAGQKVEVLTTCVEKFGSDWNVNFHKPGCTEECGLLIRRFKVRKRNTKKFDTVNLKLMNNQLPLSEEDEKIYTEEMINSPELYQYMDSHSDEYSVFVFIPYMFGTTYYGMQVKPRKSVLIPCLHDESYIHMEVFKKLFSQIGGMIFHAKPEAELAQSVYDLSNVQTAVLGEGIDTDLTCDGMRFREKYHIQQPFIIYAGRKDVGKNVYTLLTYFNEYHKKNRNQLKLLLLGGGTIQIPDECRDNVVDLGFVPLQDKYDAYAAAEMLCQPSHNESFSLVIMESWLCHRPVLVSDACEVTKNFVKESNGGLYFKDYFEFEACVNWILENQKQASIMGEQGRKYVMKSFEWNVIVERYIEFFQQVAEKAEEDD